MNANEFIQSIYKGENLDMCEEHLKAFCKEKVKELIPEHFEEIQKYKDMIAAQNAIHESFEADLNEKLADRKRKFAAKAARDARSNEEKIASALKGCKAPEKFKKVIEVYDFDGSDGMDFVVSFNLDEDGDYDMKDFERAVSNALKGLKVVSEDGETFIIKNVTQEADVSSVSDDEDSIGFKAHFTSTKGLKESVDNGKLLFKTLKSKYKGPSKPLKIREFFDFDSEDGSADFVVDFEFPEDEGFGDIIDDIESAVSKALKGLKLTSEDGETCVIKSVEQNPDVTTRGDPEEAIGFTANF